MYSAARHGRWATGNSDCAVQKENTSGWNYFSSPELGAKQGESTFQTQKRLKPAAAGKKEIKRARSVIKTRSRNGKRGRDCPIFCSNLNLMAIAHIGEGCFF